MDEQELENMLKPFGHVISTRILRDANGLSRGVGFARYAQRETHSHTNCHCRLRLSEKKKIKSWDSFSFFLSFFTFMLKGDRFITLFIRSKIFVCFVSIATMRLWLSDYHISGNNATLECQKHLALNPLNNDGPSLRRGLFSLSLSYHHKNC